VVKTSATNHIP